MFFFFLLNSKIKLQNNNRLHYTLKEKKSLSHLTQSLFSFNYVVLTRKVNVSELC